MKEYTVFPNILDNSIIFLKGHCDYQGADYLNTLLMDKLIRRSLPKHKKDIRNSNIQKATLYTAPEELKITSIGPITPLPNKFDFQVYPINAVGYKHYLKDLGIECFTMLMAELDHAIAIY